MQYSVLSSVARHQHLGDAHTARLTQPHHPRYEAEAHYSSSGYPAYSGGVEVTTSEGITYTRYSPPESEASDYAYDLSRDSPEPAGAGISRSWMRPQPQIIDQPQPQPRHYSPEISNAPPSRLLSPIHLSTPLDRRMRSPELEKGRARIGEGRESSQDRHDRHTSTRVKKEERDYTPSLSLSTSYPPTSTLVRDQTSRVSTASQTGTLVNRDRDRFTHENTRANTPAKTSLPAITEHAYTEPPNPRSDGKRKGYGYCHYVDESAHPPPPDARIDDWRFRVQQEVEVPVYSRASLEWVMVPADVPEELHGLGLKCEEEHEYEGEDEGGDGKAHRSECVGCLRQIEAMPNGIYEALDSESRRSKRQRFL